MKILLSGLLILSGNFYALSQTSPAKISDHKESGLKGQVSSIKETKFTAEEIENASSINFAKESSKLYYYNISGYLTQEFTYDSTGNLSDRWKYGYDSKNNLIRAGRFDKEDYQFWNFTSFYNLKGKLLETNVFEDSDLIETTTYNYDSNDYCIGKNSLINGAWKETYENDSLGNIILHVIYDADGKIISRKKNRYDNLRRKIETVKYDPADSLIGKEIFNYDSSGNLTDHTEYSKEGNLLKRNAYIYDQNDNLIEHSYFTQGDVLHSKTSYVYIYDKSKNWVRKTEFISGSKKVILEREISYFVDGESQPVIWNDFYYIFNRMPTFNFR